VEPDPTLWVQRMVSERFHRDDEGRPLREGRTPEDYLRPDDIEWKPCPYAGSRRGHPRMNVSALRQTSAHWDELIEALAFLRGAYARARGGYGPDVMDIWRVSQLGSALPWFYVLPGRPLPAYAAALSKATLGTGILAQRLIVKMIAERWMPPPFTTQALTQLAEDTGTLVGATEVCAAPEKMIHKFIEVIVEGAPEGSCPLAAEHDAVLRFGACYSAFKLAVWIYFQARRFIYADIGATELLDDDCEPPDFYIIEPPDLRATSPVIRAAWLHQLAKLIVPFSPDGSDANVLACVERMADAMAREGDPVATYDELDAAFGDVVRHVETGFRGTPYTSPIDEVTRDRLLARSPRAHFAAKRQ